MNEYEQVTALEWARTKAKWFFSAMAVVMIGALFFGLQTGRVECGSGAKDPQAEYTERQKAPVATVGANAIPRGEYERYFRRIIENQQSQSSPGTLIDPMQEWQMKAQAISALISSELLEQKALEHGLVPDEAKVEEQMKLAESNLLPPMAIGTDRSILQKIGDGLQEKKRHNQFAAAVQKMTGLTMKEFEKMIELQIIQQDYEEILRKEAEGTTKAEALKAIEEIKVTAEAGDFAAIAKEKSQDFETKDVGGRLDLLSVAQMFNDYGQEYIDVLRNTAPGTISKPIYVDKPGAPDGSTMGKKGYMIVKLDTFRRAEGPEFEAEKESVRNKILEKKRQDAQANNETDIKVDATEDEIRDAYEVASLWQIFVAEGSPDQAFADAFDKLLDESQIEVQDPELKAGYLWMVREDTAGALASQQAALEAIKKENAEELATVTDPDDKESVQLAHDLEVAAVHYVLGQLESLIPDMADQKRMQDFFAANQNNLDAFSSFPEPTEEETKAAEEHRKNALTHYETSYKLDAQRPWTPIAMAQTIIRLELKDRYPEALGFLTEGIEYASLDLQIHQRAQQAITSLKGLFDAATQADLITQSDELLTKVSTAIADIQKKQEEFQKKQEEEMQALLDQSKPETQAEMTPEDPAAAPAEGDPAAAPVEGAPPAEGAEPIEIAPPADASVEGTPPAEGDAPAEGTP